MLLGETNAGVARTAPHQLGEDVASKIYEGKKKIYFELPITSVR